MRETVYIETSVLGYLTARSTRDLIIAANIELTKIWWNTRRKDFVLYTSQAVATETSQGDSEMAAQRLSIAKELPLLDLNEDVEALATQFLSRK